MDESQSFGSTLGQQLTYKPFKGHWTKTHAPIRLSFASAMNQCLNCSWYDQYSRNLMQHAICLCHVEISHLPNLLSNHKPPNLLAQPNPHTKYQSLRTFFTKSKLNSRSGTIDPRWHLGKVRHSQRSNATKVLIKYQLLGDDHARYVDCYIGKKRRKKKEKNSTCFVRGAVFVHDCGWVCIVRHVIVNCGLGGERISLAFGWNVEKHCLNCFLRATVLTASTNILNCPTQRYPVHSITWDFSH